MTNFTEQFATEYARNAVPTMLKAIDSVKRYNRFVLLAALATSYLHQAHYLWTQGASYFAYLVPLIFDAAMVSMLVVVRTHGIARDAKRGALAVFTCAAIISATVNFASPGSLGLRLIFALVVLLVIGVELVAGRIRPDFAAIDAQAAELLAAADKIAASSADTPAPTAEPAPVAETPAPQQPATPVAPAAVPDVLSRLLPTARFSIAQHEQTTGQPITADELATRIGVTPVIAGQLLAAIRTTAPTRLNGHTPTLTGGVR